jgi:ATP-dependent 26S proteasome regulatory subunit
MADFGKELGSYLRARYAIVQVVTFEEQRVLESIQAIARDINHALYVWSIASGVTKDGKLVADKSTDLRIALDFCEERARSKEPSLFVFLDTHNVLSPSSGSIYRRRLREFASNIRTQGYRSNCLLIGPTAEIPLELQKDVTLLEFPLPDRAMIRNAISSFADQHRANERLKIAVDDVALDALVEAALGLTLAEVENCLSKALVQNLSLGREDVATLLQEKQQTIRKSGILDYIDASDLSLEKVGGLEALKRWLALRNKVFSAEAKQFGLAAPKGVLLTGIPGCGKSLTAKCVSASWRLPLLKLDMGKVFQGVVGSSEANVRNALATAEAVSPAILWIDEIEKGLSGASGSGGDGGTAVRVFGTLLTWMQEKTAPVFVFATANDISALPPELLRKGRFDEIFFVDLPSEAEREAILRIQVKSRGRDPAKFDFTRLSKLSGETALGDGIRLSGAELEAWTQDALLEAFRRKGSGDTAADLSMADFEQVLQRIVPMAKMRKTDIGKLRAWAGENAVSASQRTETLNQANPQVDAANASGGRALDF